VTKPPSRPRPRGTAALTAALTSLALAASVALLGGGTAAAAAATAHVKTTRFTSLHWVGYTFPVRHVTGVRAQWTEPRVTGKRGTEEFVWLGVGGWNQSANNIIQDGTFAYFPPGGGPRHEGVWYERVPINPDALFPLVGVGPGDHISAAITLLSSKTHRWRMSLTDLTTKAKWSRTFRFKSLEEFPSFVVEDPNKGPASTNGPFYPFPRWKSVRFTSVGVRIRGTWTPAAKLAAYRINMVRGGRTLATAGAISKSSAFTVTQK
jgi:Peptidase A4 family